MPKNTYFFSLIDIKILLFHVTQFYIQDKTQNANFCNGLGRFYSSGKIKNKKSIVVIRSCQNVIHSYKNSFVKKRV